MKFLALLFVFGLTIAAHAGDITFHQGDCWSYHPRPGEEASFLVIRKIDQFPNVGEVAHVSVLGLHLKNPSAPGGVSDNILHLPMAAENLRQSVTKKLHRKPPYCDWESGYKRWRRDNGGVMNASVSKCVTLIEDIMNR